MPTDPWCCEPTILLDNPPMTLGNMRTNGVRSLIVSCSNVNCRHEAIVNVDSLADDVFVPSLGQECVGSGAASAARTFGQTGMRVTQGHRSRGRTAASWEEAMADFKTARGS